jgi:hypothetical protein
MNLPHGFEHYQAPWLFWGALGFALLVGFWLRASLARGATGAKG